jgi:hypothetical protein
MANVHVRQASEEMTAQRLYVGLSQMARTARLEKEMSVDAMRAGRV